MSGYFGIHSPIDLLSQISKQGPTQTSEVKSGKAVSLDGKIELDSISPTTF